MNHKLGIFFLKMTRGLWYGMAVLIPLVIFPWTTDRFDFNKGFLLTGLAFFILLSALFGMIFTHSLRLKVHRTLLLPLFALVVAALSSVFSLAPWTSWLGEGGQEHVSFITMLVLTMLMYVGAVFFEDEDMQKGMAAAIMIGSGLSGALSLLTYLGVSLMPFQNTVGLPTSFALYLLMASMFGAAYWLTDEERGANTRRTLLYSGLALTGLSAILTLAALDAKSLWTLTIIVTLLFLSFAFGRSELLVRPVRLFFPALLLMTAVLFLFVPSPFRGKYPLEVGLSNKLSFTIAGEALKERPFLGGGPGTFSLLVAKHATPAINATYFWDTRFATAKSEFLTELSTFGALGVLLLLLFPLSLLGLGVKYLASSHHDWKAVFPPFMAGVTLLTAFFFAPFSLTHMFFVMLFSAWVAAHLLPPSRDVSHAHSPRLAMLASLGALAGSVAVLVAVFFSLSRYSAELAFAKAVARDRAGAPATELIVLLNAAATRNPHSDVYFRNLANALIIQTSEVAKDPKADPKALQGYLAATVNTAMAATTAGPNNALNWEMLGSVYREFSSVVDGANAHGITAYEKAITLSPNNPKYYVGLARVYIVRADLLLPLTEGDDKAVADEAKDAQAEALVKAGEALEKAIALKKDYAPAQYFASFVEERKGNLTGAVRSMEVARAISPNDVGLSIQLSLLYLRQGKNDLAAKELERAMTLDPKNENVKWYLSVAFEAQGEKEAALKLLEELVLTNPDNTAVTSRLEKLKKGEVVPAPIPEPLEPAATETVPATP